MMNNMNHISWNYKGYDDLDLEFKNEEIQATWNITLLNAISVVFGEGDTGNIFVSRRYLPIFESMVYYDASDRSVGGMKIIPLDIDTPKIYVTESHIKLFMAIEHDNHGSVVITNCDLPEYVKTYK